MLLKILFLAIRELGKFLKIFLRQFLKSSLVYILFVAISIVHLMQLDIWVIDCTYKSISFGNQIWRFDIRRECLVNVL